MFPQEADGRHPGVQGGRGSAGDGHHVLPVRGAARPRPHHVGREPGRRGPELLAAGADIVGMNCGRGPDRAIVIIREMRRGHRRAAHRVSQRGAADHHRRADHLRARSRGDGQGLPGAARRRLQHRRAAAAARTPSTSASSPRSCAPAARGERGTRPSSLPLPSVLEDLPLAIDRDEVLRFQGYKKGVDVPAAEVLAIFDEALALGRAPPGAAGGLPRDRGHRRRGGSPRRGRRASAHPADRAALGPHRGGRRGHLHGRRRPRDARAGALRRARAAARGDARQRGLRGGGEPGRVRQRPALPGGAPGGDEGHQPDQPRATRDGTPRSRRRCSACARASPSACA